MRIGGSVIKLYEMIIRLNGKCDKLLIFHENHKKFIKEDEVAIQSELKL